MKSFGRLCLCPRCARSSAGLSMIELLVSIGIMGLVLAGFVTIQEIQVRATKGLTEKMGALSLEKTLLTSLADGKVCNFIFAHPEVVGLNPLSATFDSDHLPLRPGFKLRSLPYLASATGGTAALVGEAASVTSPTLKVKAISIDILGPSSLDQYEAALVVAFNSQPEVNIELRPLVFPIQIQTAGPPNQKTVTGCRLAFGAGAQNFLAKWETTTFLGISSVFEDPGTGNVGVGTTAPSTKIDVAGEMKISNSGTACTTTNEGSLRYNTNSKKIEFCNGTAWSPMGGNFNEVWACPCGENGTTAVVPRFCVSSILSQVALAC